MAGNPPVSITRKNLARGIDSFSPKGSVADGFAEDLQNVDTNASGSLTTRKGYEGYYGWIPFRVKTVEHSGTTIRLQFADSQQLDLSATKIGPLVVYGKLSAAQSGDFSTTDSVHWYSGFDLASRINFAAPSGTITRTAAQHGFPDADFWVGVAESLDPNNQSNAAVLPDDTQVNTATFTATVDYTAAMSVAGFVYFRDASPVVGESYTATVPAGAVVSAVSTGADTLTSTGHGLVNRDFVAVTSTGTVPGGLTASTGYYVVGATANTFQLATTEAGSALDLTTAGTGTISFERWSATVPASVHALNTFNIVVKAFDTVSVATHQVEVLPDEVTIDSTGTVRVVFGAAFTGTLYLQAAPVSQVKAGTATVVGGGPTLNQFIIAGPPSPFLFFTAYKYNSTLARFESTMVSDWAYDAATNTTTVDYYVSGLGGEAVELYYLAGTTVANTIELTDTGAVSTTYTDSAPQLTVWGLDHEGSYRSATNPGGHVTHLDSYKRVGERRLVAGLGGNLFRALGYGEAVGTSLAETVYDYGLLSANFRQRVDGDALVAPLFWTTDPGMVRSRGVVIDTTVTSNLAVVTAATYVSVGIVDYTLSFDNKTGAIALGGAVTTFDQLQVGGLAHTEHTGDWAILSVQSDSATETVVRVANPQVNRTSLNESDAHGTAGVFTDTFATESVSNWIPGDILATDAVPMAEPLTIIATQGVDIYVSGVTLSAALPDGQRIGVTRVTRAVPLRTAQGTPSVSNLVRGDMLAVTGLSRRVRALRVQTQEDQTVTVTGTGSLATGTVSSAHRLNGGDLVVFFNGTDEGEHTVVSTPTATTFTYASTSTSGSATLQGLVVELDEALSVTDGVTTTEVQTDGRWVPIEAPTTVYDLPATTYYRHLDANGYDEQPLLRSTIISDAMFFVNQDDEVLKFDGNFLTRAGLVPWQPGLFAQTDTGATAKIASGLEVAYASKDDAGLSFEVASNVLQPGDRVFEATANQSWLVKSVVGDTNEIFLVPGSDISAAPASGTLKKVLVYRYYFRLNMIDRNNNIVVSAVTSSKDFQVDYNQEGQIKLRLVGLPDFGTADYDRIELETYRTVADGAIFHLQSRRLVDFDLADPYLDVLDALEDSLLAPTEDQNRDTVNQALLSTELGTGWEAPPRATTITTLDSRLILGNVKSYPQVSVVFKPSKGATSVTGSNLSAKIFTFRRDPADTGATTNNTDRQRFEFRTTDAAVVVAAATTTTFTVTWVAHGLVAGNWVYLFHAAAGVTKSLKWAGWWQVATVVDPDTFTVAVNSDGTVGTNNVARGCRAVLGADVPVWVGNSGADGNYNQRDASRTDDNLEFVAALRLANAVNSTQRVAGVAWLAARGGNDYRSGEVIVTSPVAVADFPEIQVPASTTGVQIFVEEVLRTADTQVSFVERVFPSRVVRSYVNYPELFDNCFAPDATTSDSVIDVNPSDGQVVTSILPFFGTSATGSNVQLNQELVVFKEQSIYIVNVETRQIVKVDSRGLGNSSLAAVCNTQKGLVFCNASGIYRLERDMSVTHVGRYLTGVWRKTVNQSRLSEVIGHHYAVGRRVKLSVPADSGLWPSQVLVYDYDSESLASIGTAGQSAVGAWTRYTNHAARNWCNLSDDAYWGSQTGDVFLVRNRNEAEDYRDEDQAVAQAVIQLRADDFDLPGVRKVVVNITTEVELELSDLTALAVECAQNLSRTFEAAGSVSLTSAEFQQVTFRATPPTRRGTHFQVRYTHQTKDEVLTLTGVVYTVAQLSYKGVKQQGALT